MSTLVVLYKSNAIVERPMAADRDVRGRWWRVGRRMVAANGEVSGTLVDECQ